MQTATVTNPLGLDIEWRSGIEPLHEAFDAPLLATITASMEANGWQGPPLVCSWDLRQAGQDRAFTGSHRWQAWLDAHGYVEAMPCVYIEDICEKHGIDFDALLDEHDGDDYEAVMAAISDLPEAVCEAYGLDTGGA